MAEQSPGMTEQQFLLDRRAFLVAALGGAGALALGACSKSGSKSTGAGSTTTSTSGGPPAPLARPTVHRTHGAFGFPSPFLSNGGIGYAQMSLLYDTLLWKDGDGQLLPWLASGVQRSSDNLTYTFVLRDNLMWSDGMPLTADDVKFTFDYYAMQQMLPPPIIIQPPQGIAKVTATAPNTVVVTLVAPMVTFPEQVAGALPIIPKHIWSSISDPTTAMDPKVLVGSGPYRLNSYSGDGNPLLYTANDTYFLGAPFVKSVQWTDVADEFAALLSGAIDVGGDVVTGVRNDTLAPFKNNGTFGMISQQGNSTATLYWNLGKGGALGDVKFRQACAMAIDRNDLVTRLLGGNGQPGNPGFLGPENPFKVAVTNYKFDVAGANSLLDSAGYKLGSDGVRADPKGAKLSYRLLVSTDQAPVADLIVSALKPIGVNLTTMAVQAGPQLFGTKLQGMYDMALLTYPGPTAGGPNGDPDLLRKVFSSKSPPSLTGASGYMNPTFDNLADMQLVTFDDAQRKSIVGQMQNILATDLPVLSLYYPETFIIYRKAVVDQWYFTPGEYPASNDNKQLYVTGLKSGSKIRPSK